MDREESKVDGQQLDFYRENGYFVVRGVFDRTETDKLRVELDAEWLEQARAGHIVQDPKIPVASLYPPLRNLHLSREAVKTFALDVRNVALARQFLGEEPLIVGTTGFFKAPGSPRLPWHQDNYDIGAAPGSTVAIWISLDRADAENGGLRFVPRTHELGFLKPRRPGNLSAYGQTVEIPKGYKVAAVETEPGDAVIFHGHVLHGSGPNTTADRFRYALVTHYVGESVQSIFAQSKNLLDRAGRTVTRPLNKAHSFVQLFREP